VHNLLDFRLGVRSLISKSKRNITPVQTVNYTPLLLVAQWSEFEICYLKSFGVGLESELNFSGVGVDPFRKDHLAV